MAGGAGETGPDRGGCLNQMFWLKRLKSGEEDVHWSVPYGDLMTLLLAVFVMIAGMSELKAGANYDRMAGGVRQAFGFRAKPVEAVGIAAARPLTLLERLEQVARTETGTARLDVGSDQSVARCEITRESDCLLVRVVGPAAFERFSAALKPAANRLLERLGSIVAAGRATIEVRGYTDEGTMPAGVPFRDGWDLSYQRARAASEVLACSGVSPDRLCLTAMGDRRASDAPRATSSPAAAAPSAARGVSLEIVVRATAAHAQ